MRPRRCYDPEYRPELRARVATELAAAADRHAEQCQLLIIKLVLDHQIMPAEYRRLMAAADVWMDCIRAVGRVITSQMLRDLKLEPFPAEAKRLQERAARQQSQEAHRSA